MATILERLGRSRRFGVRLGLEPMRRALLALGSPERAFRAIHLAGTNGKGSTAAMIASCLRAQGIRCGLFTSPHLSRVAERIQVDGREIPAVELERIGQRVFAADADLSFFEALTAIGLRYFADQGVAWAVVETGLGGRLDATNVIGAEAAVITSIGRDHCDVLGGTLEAIAAEKAGIIKPGALVVAAAVSAEVDRVIEDRAAAAGADVLWISAAEAADSPPTSLAGEHQRLNAALASATLRALDRCGALAIEPESLRAGLRAVRWPGRLEWIEGVLLDCAHNADAAHALARALPAMMPDDSGFCLVFGQLADKDIASVLDPLIEFCPEIYLVAPPSDRASSPQAMARRIGRGRPVDGVAEALSLGRSGGRPMLITGSAYLVGEARALLLDEPTDAVALSDPQIISRGPAAGV